ncbi:hypothetical protein ACP4OV_025916 [Aristida adscensionis]
MQRKAKHTRRHQHSKQLAASSPPPSPHSSLSSHAPRCFCSALHAKLAPPRPPPPLRPLLLVRSIEQRAAAMNKAAYDVPYCSFHPRELVVGVCAHCLRDRLLLLLAATDTDAYAARRRRKTSSISLPKVFALGSSFLQRLDSRHHRAADDPHSDADADADVDTSVASLDDSFISIKFEDNGKATWDKPSNIAKAKPAAPDQTEKAAPAPVRSSSSSTTVVVAEHVKRGGVTRWRKQVVGRLLQLARWRRSSASKAGAAAACHVVGLDGKKAAAAAAAERSKGRGRGWIRSLTRRRAAAAHGERAWS